MSDQNYRLYSFVANGYLSPLQCGLQTAHAIAEMSVKYNDDTQADHAYRTWAGEDKVIIICAAFNSKGVASCVMELNRTGADCLGLPVALFCEDEDSLGGAATACAVVVPEKYWNTTPSKNAAGEVEAWGYVDLDGYEIMYPLTHPEGQFIDHIKGYRLA